ncbi:MAG: flavin reductase [Betaproteobacteria bacterium]|nr:flavin reductase [Betaproteobacteria bacterium]
MVLWSQAISAQTFTFFRDSNHLVVNILTEQQQDQSQRFATQGIDKFDRVRFHLRLGAIPTLHECCAYVECIKVPNYARGDCVVYLGELLRVEYTERRSLVFARGK